MRLLLVRHGEAVDPAEVRSDGLRWLTPAGRSAVRAVAGWLAARDALPVVLYTSPLVRAVQTAEILAVAALEAGLQPQVRVLTELAPGEGTSAELLVRLQQVAEAPSVAFVGHEPGVRIFAGHLLRSPSEPFFAAAEARLLRFDPESERAEPLERFLPPARSRA